MVYCEIILLIVSCLLNYCKYFTKRINVFPVCSVLVYIGRIKNVSHNVYE